MKLDTSLPTKTVFVAVEQFVQQALADGCNPAELSCALTALAVRIGLDLASSTGRAVSDAAGESGASQSSQGADLDTVATSCESTMFKRESDRDRPGNNVVAEPQHSSAPPGVSALRAAFRRCRSDSEFRALFITNCRNQ